MIIDNNICFDLYNMAEKGEKILTTSLVGELGLNKVSVITADMLYGYTSIGDMAFYGCSGLTSVTIPDGVTTIGGSAFWGCRGLNSIEIPDSVKSIGCYAFYKCSGLTSITIPNSVISIGVSAFAYCSGLTSVTIPNSVIGIGGYAFSNCTSLTSITIPDSVTRIGSWVFKNCCGLTYPVYNAHVFVYMPTYYSGAYTIQNGIESIAGGAFEHCCGLTSIVIPDSVTSVGIGAFHGCRGLTSLMIPNSVTRIGDSAFTYCTSLNSVAIGDKTYKTQTVTNGKCKAYKAFNPDMTCKNFQYEEGKTYEFDGKPELCLRGFHACLTLTDVFGYYCGKIGENVVIYEVELEGVSDERNEYDSKVVAGKITIGKQIL